MPDPARMLSWLGKVLTEHEPADDLSFDAIATRFTAVLQALLAVERGAGMAFGTSLTAESAEILGGAGLPAFQETLARLRAHLEDGYGDHGRIEIARRAARRGPPPPAARVDAIHLSDAAPPAPCGRGSFPSPLGGLVAAGFGLRSEHVLVVSHDGRGVFDGRTGERLARVRGPVDDAWYRPEEGFAIGIGPLGGGRVAIDGLDGRRVSLARETEDGWQLVLQEDGSGQSALLAAPPAGAGGPPFTWPHWRRCARPGSRGAGGRSSSPRRTLCNCSSADLIAGVDTCFPRDWMTVSCRWCSARQAVFMPHWGDHCDLFTLACARCEALFDSLASAEAPGRWTAAREPAAHSCIHADDRDVARCVLRARRAHAARVGL